MVNNHEDNAMTDTTDEFPASVPINQGLIDFKARLDARIWEIAKAYPVRPWTKEDKPIVGTDKLGYLIDADVFEKGQESINQLIDTIAIAYEPWLHHIHKNATYYKHPLKSMMMEDKEKGLVRYKISACFDTSPITEGMPSRYLPADSAIPED